VPVGGRAFEVIEVLAQSAGELVTKDELMNRVWPGAIVTENTLHVHATAIRKALGPSRNLLKTEPGRGYRLLGDWTVRRQDAVTPPIGRRPVRLDGASPVTNFPATVTRLIGRTAAVARLRDLLSAYRVVTLTGPGGIGKTSLALKAACGVVGDFAGGAWLIELASLSDPTLVPSTIVGVLGLKPGPGVPSDETVARAIGDSNLLLLLDNCEHVIDAAAKLIEALMHRCPSVTILATSREVLRVGGEYVYRVAPLDVPDADEDEPDHILSRSAVELFITRANALNGDFSPRAEGPAEIAAVCRHLDGIPLAIELAAAYASVLGVQQTTAGLRHRFELLKAGRRTALPRHRTLRAVLDWSYDLLPEPEQRLLRCLAIFSGGFTLIAAAAVMNDFARDAPAVTDGIANLVTKSLVALDRTETEPRWYLLETTRAYALGKLAESGEVQRIAQRHAEFFCDLLGSTISEPRLHSLSENSVRFTLEIDNIRAALGWTFSDAGISQLGVRLAAKAVDLWLSTSLLSECCDWCTRALAQLGVDAGTCDEMLLQCGLGISLIRIEGMKSEAEAALTRAAALSEELPDFSYFNHRLLAIFGLWLFSLRAARLRECLALAGKYEVMAQGFGTSEASATAHRMLGQSQYFLGEFTNAAISLQRARAWYPTAVRSDDPVRYDADPRVVDLCYEAVTLWSLGFVEKALRAREEALKQTRDISHPVSRCIALAWPGSVLLAKVGDLETAEDCVNELIDHSDKHSLIPYYAFGLCAKGSLMATRGGLVSARRLLRDGLQRMRSIGYHLYYAFFLAEWAMVLASADQLDQAIAEIDAAQRFAEESQSLWCLPEVLRIKGEILLKCDPSDVTSAESQFERARALAHNQEGLSWELRAAISLARLLRNRRRSDEACRTLQPVYDRFVEGFDSADLKTAKALLDSLQ